MRLNWKKIDAYFKESTETNMSKEREEFVMKDLSPKEFEILIEMIRKWEDENCE